MYGIAGETNRLSCAFDCAMMNRPAISEGDMVSQAQAQTRASTRLLSVELLRIVSMLSIAVFHTFQPFFEAIVSGAFSYSTSLTSATCLTTLGFIDQLGSFGNHVFIMISGYFLLSQSLNESPDEQRQKTIRRVRHILLTVGLYGAVAVLVGSFYPKATSASFMSTGWLTQGLQFIWVYLLLVALCPLIARMWKRCPHQTAVLAVAALVIYGINVYIAYVSPGESKRALFEWRKLMSAVTYGLSFVIGGWIARLRQEGRKVSFRNALVLLLLSVAATFIADLLAARRGDLTLLNALSYKSTSPLACLMATSAFLCALSVPQPSTDRAGQGVARVVAFLTSGMLGFYVMQSLLSRGWHKVSNVLLFQALEGGLAPFLLTGIAFSVALFLVLTLIDALVRKLLLERNDS